VLKRILGAHAVNGYMPIPSGFKSGRTYQTLTPGATLTVQLQEAMMPGGYMMGHATVRDASGTTAKVIAPNQFTGLATVHAIDKVLAPPAARAVTLPARVDAAATTPAATTADAAPAATTAAAPAATTSANSMAGMGRRLSQFRSADNAASLAQNNARDAIIASVSKRESFQVDGTRGQSGA
jgi:hypothetical protein